MTTPGSSSQAASETAEARRVRERFERLMEGSIAISAAYATDAVLQQIVESARSVVGSRYAALGVIGPDRRTLVRFVTAGLTDAERERIGALPSGQGLLGALIVEARPLRITSIAADPRKHGFPANHPRMESFLGVPIKSQGEVYGNLYLTEKLEGPEFTDEDERIAVLLAARAGAAIHTARLIEQQAELVTQLQTLQRQRDQFFAMINHELRNALTGVFGWAEQLQRARSPAVAERAGREVFESAERTITLLNNLLDLSRLDAGRAQVLLRTVNLCELIDRTASGQRPAAAEKRVEIRVEGGERPVTLHTDPSRLAQILVNLLSNAIRHSPPGEIIVVRCEEGVDEAHLNVIDRGHGIAQEDQQRIFEPYVRVDPESGLGSGLGLPVSKRLAELLGGRLSVSSNLGSGATFTLSLPLRRSP